MGFRAHPHIGRANVNWRGNKFGYGALHDWIRRVLGMSKKCSKCGTKKAKKYEWANISGKYKRNVKDWIRLCVSCHRFTDGHGKKAAAKRYGHIL